MISSSPCALDDGGNIAAVRQVRSPNHDARPAESRISLLVIHGISLPPRKYGGSEIEELFCNTLDSTSDPALASLAGMRVSAHFLVRRDGGLVQFVPCQRRAWHAGVSNWRGRDHCNDYSIGIELEGVDDQRYETAQYRSLAHLTRCLASHYPIEDIVGHSEIAPGRKTDPGPAFDWREFRALLIT